MLRLLKICCKPSSDLVEIVYYLLCKHLLLLSVRLLQFVLHSTAAAALLFASVWSIAGPLTIFPATLTSLKAVNN